MRTVTENAIKAFLNGKNCKLGGVCNNQYAGNAYGEINTEIDNGGLYLFGNCIAKLVNNELYVRLAGYNTHVTRERLNGFSQFGYKISICSKKFTPYLNGEVMDGYKWYKIDKI